MELRPASLPGAWESAILSRALPAGEVHTKLLEYHVARAIKIVNVFAFNLEIYQTSKGGSSQKEHSRHRAINAVKFQIWRRSNGIRNCQEFNLHVCLQKWRKMDFQGCSLQIVYNRKTWNMINAIGGGLLHKSNQILDWKYSFMVECLPKSWSFYTID